MKLWAKSSYYRPSSMCLWCVHRACPHSEIWKWADFWCASFLPSVAYLAGVIRGRAMFHVL